MNSEFAICNSQLNNMFDVINSSQQPRVDKLQLAAVAGLLFATKDNKVEPLMGLYVGLKAFIAAVIGGIGHVPGAVVGALLLGLCEEFIVGYAASSWRDAVAFGFLIIVLLVRPGGLFGRVTAEKV